jgi:hypothetical protein
MKSRLLLLFPLILLCCSASTFGQLWSGILDPSRAVDWTQAGFPGGALPDANWAQCVTSACNAVVSAGSGATVSQINAAIASAPANTYVSVGAGTFNFSGPIIISDYSTERSNVVLRGQGASSTLFVFSGSTVGGCYQDVFSLEGDCVGAYPGGEGNVCLFNGASTTSKVTPGTYQQGATYLSISNCGGTTPALGSFSNLKVGGIIMVDQLNETTDTGTIWNCDVSAPPASTGCAGNGDGGGTRFDGLCNGSTCERSQMQGFVVVGISGSVVQVDQPLYLPQWRSSQQPQAWFPTNTVTQVGVENLSVDTTNLNWTQSTFNILSCNQCWVAGVRSVDSARSHIRTLFSTHNVIRDNYLTRNQTASSSSYGMEVAGGWYHLIENNITQQVTDSDPSCTAPCAGNVVDYNFDIDNSYSNNGNGLYIVPPFFQHASGDVFNLWEGNIGPGYSADNIHGTHHLETAYRNLLPGWSSHCYAGALGSQCLVQTTPFIINSGSRYFNFIGNVLGQGPTQTGGSNYHIQYECESTVTSNCLTYGDTSGVGHDAFIYGLGYTCCTYPVTYTFCQNSTCSSTGGSDPLVWQYAMRWGNYDVVTAGVRFCGNSSDTGWSSTCSSTSEVPTGIGSYANPVPSYGDTGAGQPKMPPSFYYSSEPPFLSNSNVPWPVVGPDVTGGNLGNCENSSGTTPSGMAVQSASQCGSGFTLVTAWAGHANANAAMACYLNSMNGPPDGTGGVLSFSAAACYPSTTNNSLNPPTGLSVVVN